MFVVQVVVSYCNIAYTIVGKLKICYSICKSCPVVSNVSLIKLEDLGPNRSPFSVRRKQVDGPKASNTVPSNPKISNVNHVYCSINSRQRKLDVHLKVVDLSK